MQELDFSKLNVLVVGDFILDEYIGGDVERISPEAPVPVLKMTWNNDRLGGAGNVVNNLRSLGANARILTCIGSGRTGTKLFKLLEDSGADTSFVKRDPTASTIKKIRIVAKNQQVIRVDDEDINSIPESFSSYIMENSDRIFDGIDAVILSDYGKGVLNDDTTRFIIKTARSKNIPAMIDPKGSKWEKYTDAVTCTPNLNELSQVYGNKINANDEDTIRKVGKSICEKYALDFLIVTRSENGMSVIDGKGKKQDFPVVKKEVIDVSGAGDTVITTFTLCYVLGLSLEKCCKIANIAASIVVSKFGTATLTIHELNSSLIYSTKKIVSGDDIEIIAKKLHNENKKIVFTNGCFDLMHSGHIASFEQARSFGDVLVVGVNSDESVRRLKGPNRPIIDEKNRMEVIRSLSIVDYVVLFGEDTPLELIKRIIPDILVKGKDYADKEVVGRDVVESHGGRVELIDLVEGMSTTKIIEKILSVYTKGE